MVSKFHFALIPSLVLGLCPYLASAQNFESYDYFRVGVGYSNIPGTTRLSSVLDTTSSTNTFRPSDREIPQGCFEGEGITHYFAGKRVESFAEFGNVMAIFAAKNLGASFYCDNEFSQPQTYIEVSNDGIEWLILNSSNPQIHNHFLREMVEHIFEEAPFSVKRHQSGGVILERDDELKFIFSVVDGRYGAAIPAEDTEHQEAFLEMIGYTDFDSVVLDGPSWADHGTLVWLGEVDHEEFFTSLNTNILAAFDLSRASLSIKIQQLEHGFGTPVRKGWLQDIYEEHF